MNLATLGEDNVQRYGEHVTWCGDSHHVDPELVGYLDRRFNELRNDLRTEFRHEITTSAAETRRHFNVGAEQMMSKLQLVAEGVIAIDQKVDRLTAEMRGEFQKVDRRFLHLEARITALRD